MSTALKLLEKVNSTPQKVNKSERPKLFLDAKEKVQANHFSREVSLDALGRYFCILDRRKKELEAELNAVKNIFRNHCSRALDNSADYFDAAVVGPVKCVRQNRFQAVKGVSRDELVGAIGEVEYRSMFTESASIQFKDSLEMQQFLSRCELAGVELGGQTRVDIKPRSEVKRRVAELGETLNPEHRQLVLGIARDSQLAVGRSK